jgi:hypothetical protein
MKCSRGINIIWREGGENVDEVGKSRRKIMNPGTWYQRVGKPESQGIFRRKDKCGKPMTGVVAAVFFRSLTRGRWTASIPSKDKNDVIGLASQSASH